MSAIHTAIVVSIQFALAIGAALLLWTIIALVVHAILFQTIWRARPVDRGGEP